jgi:hypothetical protein
VDFSIYPCIKAVEPIDCVDELALSSEVEDEKGIHAEAF